MTQFTQKTFSVGEDSRSAVPEEERRARWNSTFAASSCRECERLDYAQTPMKNQKCPRCLSVFCPEHLAEHNCAICDCDEGCEHLASECPLKARP
jgi:hypothetical protein